MKHKQKNPLSGKAYFDKDGNLYIADSMKFAGQIKPKISPREWFYLLYIACLEKSIPERSKRVISSWIGSRATQWRLKKSLINKGLL